MTPTTLPQEVQNMLPIYPKASEEVWKFLERIVKKEIANNKLDIPEEHNMEGDQVIIVRAGGSREKVEFREAKSTATYTEDDFENISVVDLITQAVKHGQTIGDQITRSTLEFMEMVTEKTGNSVDARNTPIEEAFLEMLEKMQIDFLPNGEMEEMQCYVHPKIAPKIVKALHKISNDPQLSERYQQVMEKKREEFYARESNRKLVG